MAEKSNLDGTSWGGASAGMYAAGVDKLLNVAGSVIAGFETSSAQKKSAGTHYADSAILERKGARLAGYGSDIAAIGARYSALAPMMAELGRRNAEKEMLKAGRVQGVVDRQVEEAAQRTRRKVGEGLTQFAANGILIEGGDSAVGRWEQDEWADSAYEQTLIRQAGEDQIYEYMQLAVEREIEGLGAAAGMYGQSAAFHGQAMNIYDASSAAYIDSWQSFQAGIDAEKAAKKSKRGAIGKLVGGVVGGAIGSIWGPMGAGAGASIGGSVGGFF